MKATLKQNCWKRKEWQRKNLGIARKRLSEERHVNAKRTYTLKRQD